MIISEGMGSPDTPQKRPQRSHVQLIRLNSHKKYLFDDHIFHLSLYK
jgi:hypothetical protein